MSADPEVMAFIGNGLPRSSDHTLESFETISRGWLVKDYGLFAIERLSNEAFIGFCGLSKPSFLPEVLPNIELGWRLQRSSWGHGLGTEAAQAVTDWAFETLDFERLISIIHVDNQASHRLATRLGMTKKRRTIVPKDSTWVDVYELERQSWAVSQER